MQPAIITIGREYGSGGRGIGRKLAEKLGIPCYDKTLIRMAAQRSGLAEESIAESEEQMTNSLLFNLSIGNFAQNFFQEGLPVMDQAYLAQFQAIIDLAQKGPCVIIGRCGDYVLRDFPNCANVFLHAPFAFREQRVVSEYGVNQKESAKLVQKVDKSRSNYYNHYTNQKWGESRNYHLAIDTSIGDEGVIELIETYLRCRFG